MGNFQKFHQMNIKKLNKKERNGDCTQIYAEQGSLKFLQLA